MLFFAFMRKTCYAIYKCNSVAIDEGINDSRNGNKNSFIDPVIQQDTSCTLPAFFTLTCVVQND